MILAVPAGMFSVPAQSLTSQFLTALVPEDQRRAAFSLDTILAKASFIIGPTLGILLISQSSAATVVTGLGAWLGLTAVALFVTNLPIRADAEALDSFITAP